MNQSQNLIEELSPVLRKFLDRVIKGAVKRDVDVEVGDREIVITGEKEAVMKARNIMQKVKGLRLDRFETDGDKTTAVFVEMGV